LGYIEETLGHSETLIYKAHFHWLHYALAWVELALILGLAVWIVFFAPNGWLQYLLLLGCAAALLLLFRSVLPFLITEIGVTSQRLAVKRGWLARSTDEIPLRSIEQVNFQQGFIGRLLGYGQVGIVRGCYHHAPTNSSQICCSREAKYRCSNGAGPATARIPLRVGRYRCAADDEIARFIHPFALIPRRVRVELDSERRR